MYSKLGQFFFQSLDPQVTKQKPSKNPDDIEKMRGMLNSERIHFIFGNFGVELLMQEGALRVSNLNSNGVMRTCAVVNFSLPVPMWFEDTHHKIYNGASIGKTIKDAQLAYTKEDAFIGVTILPQFAQEKMNTTERAAAVHIYQFLVNNPQTSVSFLYCTITELHSPLYLTLGDLQHLYPALVSERPISETVSERLEQLERLNKLFISSSTKTALV